MLSLQLGFEYRSHTELHMPGRGLFLAVSIVALGLYSASFGLCPGRLSPTFERYTRCFIPQALRPRVCKELQCFSGVLRSKKLSPRLNGGSLWAVLSSYENNLSVNTG